MRKRLILQRTYFFFLTKFFMDKVFLTERLTVILMTMEKPFITYKLQQPLRG